MKMFLISSYPLRNAVLMSPEIRRYLCEATHCMMKASDAADNVGLSRGTSVRSDPESPTHTDVLLPFQSTSMTRPISHA